MKKYYAINELFNYKDKILKCTGDTRYASCGECAFIGENCIETQCQKEPREDSRDVHFEEVVIPDLTMEACMVAMNSRQGVVSLRGSEELEYPKEKP